jgi:cytochrome c peroxidase
MDFFSAKKESNDFSFSTKAKFQAPTANPKIRLNSLITKNCQPYGCLHDQHITHCGTSIAKLVKIHFWEPFSFFTGRPSIILASVWFPSNHGEVCIMKRLTGFCIFMLCMLLTGMAFALSKQAKLGKLVYEDPAFSANGNQSCQTCHHPSAGFADPVNRISPMYAPVSEGSHAGLFGGRNAPPAAYAAYSPPLYWDNDEGLFIGGLFWDGRASGIAETTTGALGAGATGDPLADQAKGPFGNPVEMALPTTEFASVEANVVAIVAAKYPRQYRKAWGKKIGDEEVGIAYNNIALSISAFEKSKQLNRFSSKFDAFRKEQEKKKVDVSTITVLTAPQVRTRVFSPEEVEGLALFNSLPEEGGGGCFQCHPVPALGAPEAESVFTDFSYDNLGIPVNEAIAGLQGVDPIANPLPADEGLGAGDSTGEQYRILNAAYVAAGNGALDQITFEEQKGKFKVSSLRNVARTAPYGHNGFFPTLYDIVHFYNVRDVDNIWGTPEVDVNVNGAELGDLGLTFAEEQKIVLFLETLTDL